MNPAIVRTRLMQAEESREALFQRKAEIEASLQSTKKLEDARNAAAIKQAVRPA